MEPYLLYNSVEVANAARTYAYANAGLGPVGLTLTPQCSLMGSSFVSPSADPAPWYDAAKPESATFLGFWPQSVMMSPSLKRSAVAAGLVGSSLGRLAPGGQVIQVQGWLISSDIAGNEFGERWLLTALRTPSVDTCDAGTVRVLPACPAGAEVATFRDLYRTGLVDYTAAAAIDANTPWAYFRAVAFQLKSELPWMYATALTTVAASSTTFPVTGSTTMGKAPTTAGVKITIVAGTGVAAGPWTVTGTVTNGIGTSITVTVAKLAVGTTLTIDGALRDIQVRDAGGVLIGGIDALNLVAPFVWPEMISGSAMTWTVALAGGGVKNANSSAKVELLTREA